VERINREGKAYDSSHLTLPHSQIVSGVVSGGSFSPKYKYKDQWRMRFIGIRNHSRYSIVDLDNHADTTGVIGE